MTYKSDILLGRITKVIGYEGAVAVKLEKKFIENIPHLESVFLEIEGRPVPFFLSDFEYRSSSQLILTFADYNTIEKSSEFVGCRVFLTSGSDKDESDELVTDLVGYNVYSAEDKLIGSLTDIVENPGQLLMHIFSPEKKEILIPFHEHFIVRINKAKRIIVMDIPEGLTEIN